MITAADDYTHPVGTATNFNESMYFQFHDPERGLSGFVRLANRPNEGRGERTVCLYLPGGAVAFDFARPPVTTNDTMSAAGLTVEVVHPMEELRVTFDGAVRVLNDPRAMIEPKAALAAADERACHIALTFNGVSPAHEQTFDAAGESFAPNHYEQLAAASGLISLGDDTITVAGHGLRDHSWGPRSWQAPWFYRWLHGCTDEFGFMVAHFEDPDGTTRCGGFVVDKGQLHPGIDVEIVTERDDHGYQQSVTVTASAAGRRWHLRGHALSTVPLRHRGAGGRPSTRIVESAMRWHTDTGTPVYGMAEYLDQLRGGQPVGLHV